VHKEVCLLKVVVSFFEQIDFLLFGGGGVVISLLRHFRRVVSLL